MAMGKEAFVSAIAMSMVIVSLFGVQAVKVANANPIPWAFNPQMTVTIQSPENGTSYGLPVLVTFVAHGDSQFSVTDNDSQDYARSFFYVLDGGSMRTSGLRFEGTKTTDINGDPVYWYGFNGQAKLTNLTDGPHNITVYFGAVNSIGLVGTPNEMIVYNPSWSATAQFYIDSTLTPEPTQTPSPTPNPSPVPTGNWVEVARFQGNGIVNTKTEPFACNSSEWRVRWQFDPGHWRQLMMYTFSVTTYPQGETSNFIDQIYELPNGNLTGWHVIRNYEGTFFMNISTGTIKNYTVVVEQNMDAIPSATPEYTLSPASSHSPTFTPSPTLPATPSDSTTQEPTITPSPPVGSPTEDVTVMFVASLLIASIIVGLLAYFVKRRE